MLTSEDRRNIRLGAMRAAGARHSSLIFWTIVLPVILGALAVLAVAARVAAAARSWWVATLGPWLQSDTGPARLALIVVAALFVMVALRWLFRPRGHDRRGQR